MVSNYKSVLFSIEKEGNSDICCDMDELRGHHTTWNKLVTDTTWFHLCQKVVKIVETESRVMVARIGEKGEWESYCSIGTKFQCYPGLKENSWDHLKGVQSKSRSVPLKKKQESRE